MPKTPFQVRLLRVRNVEEARRFLTEALAQGDHDGLVAGDYPFDIDLAGMLFFAQNRGLRIDESEIDEITPAHLGELFADAAWEMCLAGLLRPGPRSPLDKTVHESTGYSLTEKGRASLLRKGV